MQVRKDSWSNYIKVRTPLVRHLLRNSLLAGENEPSKLLSNQSPFVSTK